MGCCCCGFGHNTYGSPSSYKEFNQRCCNTHKQPPEMFYKGVNTEYLWAAASENLKI